VTLAAATAVGFAVAGGSPSDARRWITVDLSGFPGTERRGYIVATEPVNRSWHGIELATQAREIILTELRRLRHLPADEALGRAMAAANGVVVSRNDEIALQGKTDEVSHIGVTALVFEGHTATLAHVPPGQLILVEDGLVYTVPEFDSWFPHYQPDESLPNQAEPLGFASWTAPLMAQTEVRAGDTIILTTAAMGQAYIEEVVSSGHSQRDMTWLHHKDPDQVLDLFKDVVIAREMPAAAVAVVGFPPLPNVSQIQTIGDLRRRARDRWRHGKAIVRQLRPGTSEELAVVPVVTAAELPEEVAEVPAVVESDRPKRRRKGLPSQERLQRMFETPPEREVGWRKRSESAEFGAPGTHGVDLFRNQSQYIGESNWRHRLPRLPIIGSNWVWPLLAMIIVSMVLGGLWIQDNYLKTEVDETATLASIDARILAARDADSRDEVVEELEAAENEIDKARDAGLSEVSLDQREVAVTEMLDAETDVIRMSDVQRIGSLPEEFGDAAVQGVNTPAGVFFVAGSLYQYRPNETGTTPELITILSEGEVIDDIEVGNLWGVAFDFRGLYATDGDTVFMLPVEAQEWRAVRLGRINDQEWNPGPIAAFDGSVYLLEAEYRQIYRFGVADTESGQQAAPVDWLLTGARDSVAFATDIAIDGNIYLLLEDGTVQTMYLGDMASDVQPAYIGEDRAISLVGQGGSGYLYQAVIGEENDDGRIVAFDSEGQNAVQLKLPIGFSTANVDVAEPFSGIQDVIVDESTGTIYIINADGVWTARYSLPELPAELVPTVEPDDEVPEAEASPSA
jgi:hypothetical protein